MTAPAGSGASFAGPGFGTLLLPVAGERQPPPPAVSGRALMRGALPSAYRHDDLAMRFVGALEEVLDPVGALLDGLSAHVMADFAPRPMLDLLAAWLGLTIDEQQAATARRETVRAAGVLARRRGTVAGMRLTLRLTFPDVRLRVEDSGGVWWSADGPPAAGAARFEVIVDGAVPESRLAAIARCIEREKPVETTYRLRVNPTGGTPS